MEINLISDTVTKPSKDMLNFMYDCNVGDDVFKQDPTVNELEKKYLLYLEWIVPYFFHLELWQINQQLTFLQRLETN